MEILINGKKAVLPENISFDITFENRRFSDADAYSMSITLPLYGCPENISIFGHINRLDIKDDNDLLVGEIRDRDMLIKGSFALVGIDRKNVKIQFLEGRSANNYSKTLNEIYINELNLGSCPDKKTTELFPEDCWESVDTGIFEEIALPWINNSSRVIHNEVRKNERGRYEWVKQNENISWQPYLLVIAKRICSAVGYKYDFTEWEKSDFRHLIVCNTLPLSWGYYSYSKILPKWSVEEFFRKLEIIFDYSFEFNYNEKVVSCYPNKKIQKEIINIKEVESGYTEDFMGDGKQTEYRDCSIISYSHAGHNKAKFYSCDWLVKIQNAIEYDNLDTMVADLTKYKHIDDFTTAYDAGRLYYAKDAETYYLIRNFSQGQCRLEPINVFGPRKVDLVNANEIESDIVPAWIDETIDNGDCLFLECGSLDNSEGEDDDEQLRTMNLLINGEKIQQDEFFDKLYIAFWEGRQSIPANYMPVPIIDRVYIDKDWNINRYNFSLRFNGKFAVNPAHNIIDTKKKYKFSFLSDNIPDVKKIFQICGQRYICERFTVSFDSNGRSKLIKGEFWKLKTD